MVEVGQKEDNENEENYQSRKVQLLSKKSNQELWLNYSRKGVHSKPLDCHLDVKKKY